MSRPPNNIAHQRYLALVSHYKAHYTVQETADKLNLSYATVCNAYRNLKAARTPKHSREVFLGEHNAIAV